MNIACLGWGSLIWSPQSLRLRTEEWNTDGPKLPIEFARISTDRRVTLVLAENAKRLPVLWALMKSSKLCAAINDLATREGVRFRAGTRPIEAFRKGERVPVGASKSRCDFHRGRAPQWYAAEWYVDCLASIRKWLENRQDVDAVI